MKLTEHYVESILKLICKDRMKNESRISKRRFLTWSLFRPDGRELVNRKNLLWSITGQLVQFVEKTDCKSFVKGYVRMFSSFGHVSGDTNFESLA